MKKTFSININGLLFNIDEDAFEQLSNYLKNLKKHFKNTEGGDDIVNDIESRIAELFKARMKDLHQIISSEDVKYVIDTLGQPFEMDEETENNTSGFNSGKTKKRIFRDPDNQIIAGVSSGLGAYFSIDTVIVRLLFVLSILIGGVGIVIYLTLWILTPLATTTSEKLEMEGEKVDIHSIEKKVRQEIEVLSNKFQDFTNEAGDVLKKKKTESTNGLNHLGRLFYNILRIFFRFIAILVGVVFLLTGIALSITLAATYLGIIPAVQFDEFSVQAVSLPAFLHNYIFSTPYELTLYISLILVIIIPIIALLFNGIRLIFNLGRQKMIGIYTSVIWVIALTIAFVFSIPTISQFKTDSKKVSVNPLDSISGDTLNIAIYNQQFYKELQNKAQGSIFFENNNNLLISADEKFYGNPRLVISKSDDAEFSLVIQSSVSGANTFEAEKRLENTKYYFEEKGNTLFIAPYYTLINNEKWRNQRVTFEIQIPEGKTIFLDKETKNYFQWRYYKYSKRKMAGNYWVMTDDGLKAATSN